MTNDIQKHINKFKNACNKAEKENKKYITYYIDRKCVGKKANILPKLTGKVGKFKDGLTEITSSIKDVKVAIEYWESLIKEEK